MTGPTTAFIRRFRPEDALELLELFRAAVHRSGGRHYTRRQRAAWAPASYDADAWRQLFSVRTTFVAATAEEILRFGELEADPSGMGRLYVHPDHHRRGIGRSLYDAVEHAARAEGVETLVVEASRMARPFFQKQSFRMCRKQPVFRRGVSFTNFRMDNDLSRPES